ncbi:MAG: hypothetical protein FD148_880, partial [Methylocystaceae bacterium]
ATYDAVVAGELVIAAASALRR